MRFIDTHCHIIPGVDDGPSDLAESLVLAREAARDGIGTIVATPHIVDGGYVGDDREERLSELRASFLDYGIDIELVSGAEVPLSMCLAGHQDVLERLTIAGRRYLLMETAETTYGQLARAAYQVRLCGLFPILAHPERVSFVRDDPMSLAEITARGDIFCQITAASIEGRFGKGLKKVSHDLLKRGLVHLVASDAHSVNSRPPWLSQCYDIVKKVAGEKAAHVLMVENPNKVLQGVTLESIRKEKTRGLVSRVMGRKSW